MPVLRIDAQFNVVEAALKGYMKWRASHGSKPQQAQQDVCSILCPSPSILTLSQEQERNAAENNLETWCERVLEINFEV
jgi:exportin-5